MKKKLLHTLLSLCLLSACSGNDALIPDVVQKENTLELYVTANGFIADGNPATRATDNGNATTFDNGDRVGVIVLDGSNILANNIPYQYSSGSARWTFDASNGEGKSTYYYDNKLSNLTYIVYYPYSSEANDLTSVAGLKTKFAPKADQSNKDAYRASDLMVWTSTGSAQKQLNAELTHAYASVALLPKLKCALANREEITYATTKISDVNCTLNNGTPIFPYQPGDGSYRYILPADFSGEVRWFFTYEDNTYNSPRSLSETISNTCYSSVTQIDIGEYTLDKAEVGDFYIKPADDNSGYLIPGEVASLSEEVKKACLGIVYWVGDITGEDPLLKTQHPTCTHGLVVALQDAGGNSLWSSSYEDITSNWLNSQSTTYGITSLKESNKMQGYANTQALIGYNASDRATGNNSGKKVLPIEAITTTYAAAHPTPVSSSCWYFPSVMELKYMCWGQGNSSGTAGRDLLNTQLGKVPGASSLQSNLYWSSTEYNYSWAWFVNFYSGYVSYNGLKRNYSYGVRAVLAF